MKKLALLLACVALLLAPVAARAQGQSIGTRQSGIANRDARTALPSWASVTDTPQRSAASAMEKLIS